MVCCLVGVEGLTWGSAGREPADMMTQSLHYLEREKNKERPQTGCGWKKK